MTAVGFPKATYDALFPTQGAGTTPPPPVPTAGPTDARNAAASATNQRAAGAPQQAPALAAPATAAPKSLLGQ